MSGARFGWLSTSSFGSGASSAASLIFGLRASDIGQFLHFPCMGDSYCTTMCCLVIKVIRSLIRDSSTSQWGGIGIHTGGLPEKRMPLQHHLIGDIERLEVDVVVVLALEYVVAGRPQAAFSRSRANRPTAICSTRACGITRSSCPTTCMSAFPARCWSVRAVVLDRLHRHFLPDGLDLHIGAQL